MSRRRREILDIAAVLFAERGFANVTVDEIGEAAGVSGPALYHHFASKEALLGEMLVAISRSLLDGARALADESDPDDVVEALIRFHVDFATSQTALIVVHFRDLVHASPGDQATVRALQGRYASVWTGALRHRFPDLGRRTAESIVHATFGLINSTPFSGRVGQGELGDVLQAMALAALSAGADAQSASLPLL